MDCSVRVPVIVWAVILLCASVRSFESSLYPCPAPCSGKPYDWTLYTAVDRLRVCHQPMLLDFSLHRPLDSPKTTVKLFTCTVRDENSSQQFLPTQLSEISVSDFRSSPTCITGQQTATTLDLTVDYSTESPEPAELDSILSNTQNYIRDISHCDTFNLFGYLNGTVVGIYSGAAIDNSLTTFSILQILRDQIRDVPTLKRAIIQLCGDGRNADYTFGVAVDTTGNLARVQKSVSSWSDAQCVEAYGVKTRIENISVLEKPLSRRPKKFVTLNHQNFTGECESENIVSGDSCSSLAEKCGITRDQLIEYNLGNDFCSKLIPGRLVCCTNGTSPDTRPIPNKDGSCAGYTIRSSDTCSSVAAAHGLTEPDISRFNDGTTWGWFGCDDLPMGLKICLSTGNPPIPDPISNSVCGPTVLDGNNSIDGVQLSELNPCPLNACCNIWGKCGVTPEYCTYEVGPTGNPGTAPAGHGGCISNCGTNITYNSYGPATFFRIGYYESWSLDRPCLNLPTASINVTEYSHVHWGFATVDEDFNVGIEDSHNQWGDFLRLEGVRRIISFGGWGYSTGSGTYDVLRTAMRPGNVDVFVRNILKFVRANHLDGVDIDWEYPGASDIPTVTEGLISDGPNYLSFLENIREALPTNISLSIAAPSSYWYLKAFPIQEMSRYLDYIVFMTYDLHGQWDYDSHRAVGYCKEGNCLLSHVTKAGVPSNKTAVGVSSYGRSFGMTEQSCTSPGSPKCTFEGPESTALPGICTQTAGILANAEIEYLIGVNEVNEWFYDEISDSDILVYNDTQWVSYMNTNTKSGRIAYYRSLNFAGYADWAIDLAQSTDEDRIPEVREAQAAHSDDAY